MDHFDGYFNNGREHTFKRERCSTGETLVHAMEHPEAVYPQAAVRVSVYAVNFNKVTKEQQLDVITRTFHHEQLNRK